MPLTITIPAGNVPAAHGHHEASLRTMNSSLRTACQNLGQCDMSPKSKSDSNAK